MPLDPVRLGIILAQIMALSDEGIEMLEAAKPPNNEDLWLARAIQGEGAAYFGDDRDEVGLWIAHTALNRLGRSWWPQYKTVVDVVKDAFHGIVNVGQPEQWAIDLAQQALNRETDITGSAFFVLSGTDLDVNGWPSREALQVFMCDGHEIYFFKRWPGS